MKKVHGLIKDFQDTATAFVVTSMIYGKKTASLDFVLSEAPDYKAIAAQALQDGTQFIDSGNLQMYAACSDLHRRAWNVHFAQQMELINGKLISFEKVFNNSKS